MWLPVFVICIAAILQSHCRKYDIEEECRKLYGEDLTRVLKRFRRTPEYLEILQQKLVALQTQMSNNGIQILHYGYKELEKKMQEYYNVTKEGEEKRNRAVENLLRMPISSPSPSFRRYQYIKSFIKPNTRQGPEKPEDATEAEEVSTPSPKELLDEEYKGGITSVAERNMYIDLGFETVGKLLHRQMSILDDDCSVRSTRFPIEGKHTHTHSTVTEHIHVVTQTLAAESTVGEAPPEGEGDNTYYRQHKNKNRARLRKF